MDEESFIDLFHKIYDFQFEAVFNEISKLENGLAKKSLLLGFYSRSENPLELIPTWESIDINEVNNTSQFFFYGFAIFEMLSNSRSVRAIIPAIQLSDKLSELQLKFEINSLEPNMKIVWQIIEGMNESIINFDFQRALELFSKSNELLDIIHPKLKDIFEYSIVWLIDYYEHIINKREFSETSDFAIYSIAKNSNLRFHQFWWKLDYILWSSTIYYKDFTNERKIEFIKECEDQAEKLKSFNLKRQLSEVYLGLATIYSKFQEYEKAISYALKCYEVSKEMLQIEDENLFEILPKYYYYNLHGLEISSTLMGVCYRHLHDYSEAINYLEIAYNLRKIYPIPMLLAFNVLQIITLLLQINEIEQAKLIFYELNQYQEDVELFKQRKMLCEALILSKIPKVRDRGKAMEILQELVDSSLIDFYQEYKIAALTLSSLLIDEAIQFNERDSLTTAINLFESVCVHATKLDDHESLVSIEMLKAKLALFDGNFEQAKLKLKFAKQIVSEKRVKSLEDEVEQEIRNVEFEFQRIRNYVEKNTEFGEKLKELELNSYIQKALQLKSVD